MRYTFVKTLTDLAAKNKDIMLLTGDLGFTVFEEFRDKYPKQFFNIGVAEQNMIGIAAGLALSGKIVFAYSIATFASMRAFEHIRDDIASHKAPVIIVGTGGGLSYAHLSITHHSIEDISLMRSIPEMTILCPCDPYETAWATNLAVQMKKPVYLRLGKKGEPTLHKNKPKLTLGKAHILKEGKDVCILATGNIVENALEAASILSQKKKGAKVVSMHTIKPIDISFIKKAIRQSPYIVTVEEHSIIGGLGSAVAEVLAEETGDRRLVRIGIPDTFPSVIGSQQFLRTQFGLDPQSIASKILRMLA